MKKNLLIAAFVFLFMPVGAFASTLVVYPNEADSVDGYYGREDMASLWVVTQGAANASYKSHTGNGFYVQSQYGATIDANIRRGGVNFKTTGLGSGVVDAADLRVCIFDKATGDNDAQAYLGVYSFSPVDAATQTDSDFSAVGTTPLATVKAFSALSSGSCYTYSITDLTQINNTMTSFSLREGHDAENSPINIYTANYIGVESIEDGDTTAPQLTITYHTGGGVSSASSGGSSVTGSGTLATSSGSLIGSHTHCTEYITTGSGDTTEVCTGWDTSLEIPMIRFGINAIGRVAVEVITGLFLLWIVTKLILIPIARFFRLFKIF